MRVVYLNEDPRFITHKYQSNFLADKVRILHDLRNFLPRFSQFQKDCNFVEVRPMMRDVSMQAQVNENRLIVFTG